MSNKSRFSILNLLFGAPPKEGSVTENYQKRQSKLVLSGSPVAVIFWTYVVYMASEKSIPLGITAAFFILHFKIFYSAAASSDAVFDSIWERLNLQSQWLDVRLQHIEAKLDQAVKATGSKHADTESGRFYWDQYLNVGLEDAYHDYPERPKHRG